MKFNEEYAKFFPDEMTDYSELVSEVSDFVKNKEVLAEIADIRSKKLRNGMAGYAARLKRKGA